MLDGFCLMMIFWLIISCALSCTSLGTFSEKVTDIPLADAAKGSNDEIKARNSMHGRDITLYHYSAT